MSRSAQRSQQLTAMDRAAKGLMVTPEQHKSQTQQIEYAGLWGMA
jgi:hypothetical protein